MVSEGEFSGDEVLASINGLRAAVVEQLVDLHVRHKIAGLKEKRELERQAVLVDAGQAVEPLRSSDRPTIRFTESGVDTKWGG